MGKRDKNHLDDLDDRINQSKNGSTENQNENSTQVAQVIISLLICQNELSGKKRMHERKNMFQLLLKTHT